MLKRIEANVQLVPEEEQNLFLTGAIQTEDITGRCTAGIRVQSH